MSVEDVIFKLGQLEPDEIARLMQDAGVKAEIACSSACAVTQYLYLETGVEDICTGLTDTSYLVRNKGRFIVQLPKTVQNFVQRFDRGVYPELDCNSPQNQVA